MALDDNPQRSLKGEDLNAGSAPSHSESHEYAAKIDLPCFPAHSNGAVISSSEQCKAGCAEAANDDRHEMLVLGYDTSSEIKLDPTDDHQTETVLSCRAAATGSSKSATESLEQSAVAWKFDESDELYRARACCECMSLRSGAYVVGLLHIVAIAAWVGAVAWYYGTGRSGAIPGVIFHSVGICAALSALISMFYGTATERPYFILPQIFITMAGIGTGVALTLLSVICMAIGTSSAVLCFEALFGQLFVNVARSSLGPIWPFCLAVIFDSGAALGIWFYNVIYSYYNYLCDKKYSESEQLLTFFWHPRSAKRQKAT